MALLMTAATDRVDLAADGGRDITRGALLAWTYLTAGVNRRFAVLADPVNARAPIECGVITLGADMRMTHDFATVDLIAQAAFTNFSAYGLNKWLRLAYVWDHSGAASDQKLYVGDESSGLAEPSAYITRQLGTGGWLARDASSFWKLGNRRTNDTPFSARLSDVLLVDRSAGSNPTAAEMDRWFTQPGAFAGAVWGFELGVGGDGLQVRNLYGTSTYLGTVTGATVDTHRSAKAYLRRRVYGGVGRGVVSARRSTEGVASVPIGSSTSGLTLVGQRATADATAIAGTLSIGGGSITLTGALPGANANAIAGMLDVSGGVALAGQSAGASAAALVGTLTSGGLTVAGALASATAAALVGALNVNGTVTLAGQRAGAAAAALTGTILFVVVLPTSVRVSAKGGPRHRFAAATAGPRYRVSST